MEKSRIALGTVQIGMSYGIANSSGQPTQEMVSSILDYALDQCVCVWDTSPQYGESEKIIGRYLKQTSQKPSIATKLPKLSHDRNSPIKEQIRQSLTQSLLSLEVDSVHYYLIHHEGDYVTHGPQVLRVLEDYKAKNLIQQIGLSVYSPEVAIHAIQSGLIDVIQLPYNLLDQRFSSAIELAKANQITVFARSVFLQGLFFLSPTQAEEKIAGSFQLIKNVHQLAREFEIPPPTFALLFALGNTSISQVLVGVEDVNQLKLNLLNIKKYHLSDQALIKIQDTFRNIPEEILNPALW